MSGIWLKFKIMRRCFWQKKAKNAVQAAAHRQHCLRALIRQTSFVCAQCGRAWRLMVLVASGFMAVAVRNFRAHCRCVFKPEGEAQRAFVFVMREVENHQVMAA